MNINEFRQKLMRIDERFEIAKNDWKNESERLVYIHYKALTKDHVVLFDIDKYWIDGFNFRNFDDDLKLYKFLELFAKFMQTPPEERVEPKRFCLKHRWLGRYGSDYLNWDKDEDTFVLAGSPPLDGYKCMFSKGEIENIKGKFDTTLEDFEQIEVEYEE